MAAIDPTDAANIINATLGTTTPYPTVSATKVQLGINAPTATSTQTQLTGTTYTTGGYTVTWNAASWSTPTLTPASNITSLNVQNTSLSTWNIIGIEVWDTAGTPKRHWYGSWNNPPVQVTNGSYFTVAAGSITISLS
jgi:hypothetical protein